MDKPAMILNTSDEAAHFVTNLSGWVSRNGIFWGKDERMARYDGCTHVVCECGKPTEKGWIKCKDCRNKIDDDLFASYEKKEWDEETPLTLFRGDEYFFDRESLEEFCEEHETTPDKLQLVLCKPNYARQIASDFYDDLPEDQSLEDVAPGLAEKISEVNRYIYENKPILSWSPSNIAIIIKS
jgi:hypothetical protein